MAVSGNDNRAVPELGDLIRQRRKERGWTQQHLAERLGVTQAVISQWELGVKQPGRRNRAQLVELLDLPYSLPQGRKASGQKPVTLARRIAKAADELLAILQERERGLGRKPRAGDGCGGGGNPLG